MRRTNGGTVPGTTTPPVHRDTRRRPDDVVGHAADHRADGHGGPIRLDVNLAPVIGSRVITVTLALRRAAAEDRAGTRSTTTAAAGSRIQWPSRKSQPSGRRTHRAGIQSQPGWTAAQKPGTQARRSPAAAGA